MLIVSVVFHRTSVGADSYGGREGGAGGWGVGNFRAA